MGILYVLLAILAFGVLIFVHECGHYFFARRFGVKVTEFSIGMGPPLVSYTAKKTGIVYKLCLLPIGGYVSMAGDGEESDDPDALPKKPAWQRLIIMMAGGLCNILIGVLLTLLLVSALPGIRTTTEVGAFSEKERAVSSYDSGLRTGDVIVSVGGRRVYIGAEVDYEIMRRGIRPVDVVVERDGKTVTLSDFEFPTFEESGQLMGGRDFYLGEAGTGFGQILYQAFFRSAMTVRMVWESLYDLVTGRYGIDALSGPVGVTSVMSEAARTGGWNFINLVALISLNLGVVNLFPLPALDGGHVVFVLWEMITKKPVPQKVENAIHTAGLVLLLVLMLVISCKDVVGLVRGK